VTAPPNTGRPNYGAGAAAIVWLAIIGVPLYALIASAFQTQAGYATGGPLATPGRLTGSNFATVVRTGGAGAGGAADRGVRGARRPDQLHRP